MLCCKLDSCSLLLHSSVIQWKLVAAGIVLSGLAAGGPQRHCNTACPCRHPSRVWASTPRRPWSGRAPRVAGASAPGTSQQHPRVAMWTWRMPSPRSASTAASPGAQANRKQGSTPCGTCGDAVGCAQALSKLVGVQAACLGVQPGQRCLPTPCGQPSGPRSSASVLEAAALRPRPVSFGSGPSKSLRSSLQVIS